MTSAALTQRALAHAEAAEWREQQQLYKNDSGYSTSLRQWSNRASAPKWRQTHLPRRFTNLLIFYSQSRQTSQVQAYFLYSSSSRLTSVRSFTVWRSSFTGRQRGPASHTHRGLCADSNNTHTQCGPVRVWHLKIRPEECFLWRLRAAAFWGQDLLLVAPLDSLTVKSSSLLSHHHNLFTTIRTYFFP